MSFTGHFFVLPTRRATKATVSRAQRRVLRRGALLRAGGGRRGRVQTFGGIYLRGDSDADQLVPLQAVEAVRVSGDVPRRVRDRRHFRSHDSCIDCPVLRRDPPEVRRHALRRRRRAELRRPVLCD